MSISQIRTRFQEVWTEWEAFAMLYSSCKPLLILSTHGGRRWHDLSVLSSSCPSNSANNCKPWNAHAQLRKPWLFAAPSSYAPLLPTIPPISKSLTNWTVIARPSPSGVNALSILASQACKTSLAPADPGAFPPSQQLDVFSVATSKTEDHDQPATRWTLDEIAATIINEGYAQKIHRSTIWRILNDADLKPHKSVYWLNSHDPDFEAKARKICQLYVNAPRFYQQGRLVICCDEKTGMQILQRNAPTQLVEMGKPEKREFEYTRLGTRTLMASFAVPTGEVVWDLGQTRTSLDFRAHILRVTQHFQIQGFQKIDWIVDNLNTHWSLDLCEIMAYLNRVAFEPKQLQN